MRKKVIYNYKSKRKYGILISQEVLTSRRHALAKKPAVTAFLTTCISLSQDFKTKPILCAILLSCSLTSTTFFCAI